MEDYKTNDQEKNAAIMHTDGLPHNAPAGQLSEEAKEFLRKIDPEVEPALRIHRILSQEEYDTEKEVLEPRLTEYFRKLMTIDPISQELEQNFSEIIELITQLELELNEKQQSAREKSAMINARVEKLVQSGKVQVDQKEYAQSAQSVEHYAGLLKKIATETSREKEFFTRIREAAKPLYLVVWHHAPSDLPAYIREKIKAQKKYMKSVKKDLAVSFSRYNYSFEAQARHIAYVEGIVEMALTQENKNNSTPATE